jgi:hypothetical protein
MATIGNMTVDELRTALAGDNSRAPSTPTAPKLGDGGAQQTFTDIVKAGVPVVSAFLGIGQHGREAAAALQTYASKIPIGGQALSGFIGSLDDARQANIKNAQQGVGGNQLFDLQVKAGAAGLTVDQYRQALTNSGGALNGLGGTAQLGSERLLKLGDAVLKGEKEFGTLGKGLVESGRMSTTELANITLISQYGSKVNLDDIEQRKKASISAGMLAAEIDRTAAITGKSRTAIAAELEERLKSPAIQGALNQMTEEQRQGFIKSQAAISGMGKGVGDLGAVLATGGRLSAENQKELMAMGPAAGEFQRAMRMSAVAQGEDQKRQAADAVERAKAKVNEFQASAQFSAMMSRSTPEVAAALQKSYQDNQLRGRTAAEMRDTGTTAEQAQRQQTAAVDRSAEGKKLDTTTGKTVEDTAQNATRIVGETQERARVNTVALTKGLAEFETELGKDAKTLASFRTGMNTVFGPAGTVDESTAKMKQFGNEMVKQFDKLAGAARQPTSEAAPAPGAAPRQGRMLGKPVDAKADGGDIAPGEISMVGEAGMEFVKGPAGVTSTKETASLLGNAMKEIMPKGGESKGIDIGAISDKINTTISSVGGASTQAPGTMATPEAPSNEDLIARTQEALRIINESGKEKLDVEMRINEQGKLRLTEYTGARENEHFTMLRGGAEARMKEIIAQADAIKTQEGKTGEERVSLAEVQAEQETGTLSAREANMARAYEQMRAMDPANMYAELNTASLESSAEMIEAKKAALAEELNLEIPTPESTKPTEIFDEFAGLDEAIAKQKESISAGTEVKDKANAISVTPAVPVKDTASAIPVPPTATVKEKETVSPIAEIKNKFTSMFESFKLPDMFNTAKLTTPKPTTIPKQEIKAEVPPPPPKPKEESPKPKTVDVEEKKATLDDVVATLNRLNSTMMQVASHSSDISDASVKTARNSAKATGNLNNA